MDGSSPLQRGIYAGPIKELYGKSALVRFTKKALKAQFDEIDLTLDGVKLFIGWHNFRREDFTIFGDAALFDKNGDTRESAN